MRLSTQQKSTLVWIISGLFLLAYSSLGLIGVSVPGIEQLLRLIASADGSFFFLTAFLASLIESLYIIGHLIPGSTLMILIAVLAIAQGAKVFILTILSLWLGWCLAGTLNILAARHLGLKETSTSKAATDKIYLTWYPAFRASHEVSEIIAGANPLSVWLSSIKVKTLVCIFMIGWSYVMSLLLDVNELKNEEGFWLVVTFSLISIFVGWKKWHKAA